MLYVCVSMMVQFINQVVTLCDLRCFGFKFECSGDNWKGFEQRKDTDLMLSQNQFDHCVMNKLKWNDCRNREQTIFKNLGREA